MNKPIPVTILTGFLGAGKTTLLNNILHSDHGLRIAVLVNDFGSINIDSQLVVDVDQDDTIELSNGCICCTIRGDLVQAMLNILERDEPPEYIIIEASGVSDPLEISITFRLPELQSAIFVDSILTVVDAEQVLSLSKENEVLAVLQVGAADIVILNKVDLVDEEHLIKVNAWIRSIIKNARIIAATYGNVPLELILGVGSFDPQRFSDEHRAEIHVHDVDETPDHHHDHGLLYHTWNWQSDVPLSLKKVQKAVEKLPIDVYRAKGFLYLADDETRPGILHVVGKRASISWGESWHNRQPQSQIVFIKEADSINSEALNTLFDGCVTSSDEGGLSKLVNNVVSWFR